MKYDYKTFYEKNAAFFTAVPLRKKLVRILDFAITFLFLISYTGLIIYAHTQKIPTTQFVALLFVPLAGLLLATVLQLAIQRPRPYAENGSGIQPLFKKSGSADKSFPSRHLVCAFVIATVFIPHIPAISAMLYFLGILLGYIRFTIGWHYPSDLLSGAGIGIAIGCLIFII